MSKNILLFCSFTFREMYPQRIMWVSEIAKLIKKINNDYGVSVLFFNKTMFKRHKDDLEKSNINSLLINRNFNSWSELYNDFNETLESLNINTIIYEGAKIAFKVCHFRNEHLMKHWYEESKKDDFAYINFNFSKFAYLLYFPFMNFLEKHKNTRFIHIIDDPMELDFSKLVDDLNHINVFEYKVNYRPKNEDNIILSYPLYYLSNNHTDKLYDFTFGFSSDGQIHANEQGNIVSRIVYSEHFDYINDKFKQHDLKYNLYVKHKVKEKSVNTLINSLKYCEKIKESYFTFVLPSYRMDQFSVLRLIEAIAYNCIPLFDASVNYDNIDFFKQNNEILQYYRDNNLIVTLNKAPKLIKEIKHNHENILKDIKNLEFFQKRSDINNYINSIKSLL